MGQGDGFTVSVLGGFVNGVSCGVGSLVSDEVGPGGGVVNGGN